MLRLASRLGCVDTCTELTRSITGRYISHWRDQHEGRNLTHIGSKWGDSLACSDVSVATSVGRLGLSFPSEILAYLQMTSHLISPIRLLFAFLNEIWGHVNVVAISSRLYSDALADSSVSAEFLEER